MGYFTVFTSFHGFFNNLTAIHSDTLFVAFIRSFSNADTSEVIVEEFVSAGVVMPERFTHVAFSIDNDSVEIFLGGNSDSVFDISREVRVIVCVRMSVVN